MRVYNVGDEPIAIGYGGKTYVFQPANGEYTAETQIVDEEVVSPNGRKMRIRKRVVVWVKKGGSGRKVRNFLEIPNEMWPFLMTGKQQKIHKGMLKKAEEIEAMQDADFERRSKEAEELRAQLESMRSEKEKLRKDLMLAKADAEAADGKKAKG